MQSFYQNMLNNVSGDTSAKTEKKVANVEPQPKEEAPKADAPYVSKKQREELYRQEQDKKRAEAIVQSLKRPRVEPDEFKKAVTKVAKRNDEESIAAARQRYLERKKLKGVCWLSNLYKFYPVINGNRSWTLFSFSNTVQVSQTMM